MHVKQLWNSFPKSSKLVWDRITFSKLTIAYFAFSLVHFFIQLSFQIQAFTINADASRFLREIVVQGNATNETFPILSDNSLRMCSWVPSDLSLDNCSVAWNGTKGTNEAKGTSGTNAKAEGIPLSTTSSIAAKPSETAWSSVIVSPSTTTIFDRPVVTSLPTTDDDDDDSDDDEDADDDNNNIRERREIFIRGVPQIFAFKQNGTTSVNVTISGKNTTLDSECVWALNWPVSVLHNTIREDFVFIAFQFWVLGMSFVALLNESIPHISASLVTHIMATAWASFQIKHTADFKSDFTRVITDGACSEVVLIPDYWHDRGVAEYSSLAFNVLALLISGFLTWKLFKSFGWQTFKRVGASLTINRIYKIVLTLSITIQLSMFFMGVTVSLWIDLLFNSAIGDVVDFNTLYKVSSFITLVLLIPWLMTGWFAVRRELRVPMFIFLVLSILYLGGWSVMFFSITFRWNFATWTFFSIMATASVFLTVVSLVLGVVCRYNFGKGLVRYFNAQHNLPDDDFQYYEGSDEEKVDFPSNEKLVPTFAAAFGARLEPSRPNISQGLRFFNRSAKPFETAGTSPVTLPPNAYTITRKVSDGSSYSGSFYSNDSPVTRSDNRSSDQSFGSLVSYYSYSDRGHSRSDSQKRWIIE